MITYVTGNILESPAQVRTNTINCVGVMGKGIALEFKLHYPAMFNDYKKRCMAHEVVPGIPYLWEDDTTQILNFPTKRHWRNDSLIGDIEDGLKYLALNYDRMGIQSLALPPLGCGNRRLQWEDVRLLIEKYLGDIPDLDVFVYEPKKSDIKRGTGRSSYAPEDTSKFGPDRKIAALPSHL